MEYRFRLRTLSLRSLSAAFPCVFLFLTASAFAQDSRTVTEPVIPPSCVRLDAKLTSVGKGLAPADESKLDTERIQLALDQCGEGHAVSLHSVGGADAFLSGSLQLRKGVTLVVEKGVT